ncbi:hypothetical protein DEO72_LG4g2199 [Vigna unguiculata]|uniref:Uncharacterized protein n=1 Tax=Vigna unguiculata TaxID=3917 RepID=A0A4D6LTF1_VIGUN|nr:hypothetical protein DEO72_LG4g2199 [Vigna unguiculata]
MHINDGGGDDEGLFEPLSLSNEVIEFDMIGLGYDATIDMEHPVEDGEDLVNIDYSPAAANSVLAAEYLHQSNGVTIRRSDPPFGSQQSSYKDEQDRTIEKLTRQLDRARRKCEVYRSNLLSILKDIEEQKLQLSVKVQNIKLGMKE